MTTPLWCLLAFAGWTMVLLPGMGIHRIGSVMRGERTAESIRHGETVGPGWYQRLQRAHGNRCENVPIFTWRCW